MHFLNNKTKSNLSVKIESLKNLPLMTMAICDYSLLGGIISIARRVQPSLMLG